MKPGTKRYNCVVCGVSPLDGEMVQRQSSGLWYCRKHLGSGYASRRVNLSSGLVADNRHALPQRTEPLDPHGKASLCPASMCPLIAKRGSPNAGLYAQQCPESDAMPGGCIWWEVGCSTGMQHRLVDERASQKLPNTDATDYDCPHAAVCSWQRLADKRQMLCPPRHALARGIKPTVVNW